MSGENGNGTVNVQRSLDETLQGIVEDRLVKQREDLLTAVREELREHRESFAHAIIDEMRPYLRAFQESRQLVEAVTKQVEAFVQKPIQANLEVTTDKLAMVLREQAEEEKSALALLASAIDRLAQRETLIDLSGLEELLDRKLSALLERKPRLISISDGTKTIEGKLMDG